MPEIPDKTDNNYPADKQINSDMLANIEQKEMKECLKQQGKLYKIAMKKDKRSRKLQRKIVRKIKLRINTDNSSGKEILAFGSSEREKRKADEQQDPEYNLAKEKLRDLTAKIDKLRLADYFLLLENPRRLFFLNLLSGIARGIGFTVGFTLLGAILIYFLRWLGLLDLPLIGDFIADLVDIVQKQLESR